MRHSEVRPGVGTGQSAPKAVAQHPGACSGAPPGPSGRAGLPPPRQPGLFLPLRCERAQRASGAPLSGCLSHGPPPSPSRLPRARAVSPSRLPSSINRAPRSSEKALLPGCCTGTNGRKSSLAAATPSGPVSYPSPAPGSLTLLLVRLEGLPTPGEPQPGPSTPPGRAPPQRGPARAQGRRVPRPPSGPGRTCLWAVSVLEWPCFFGACRSESGFGGRRLARGVF